MNVSVGRATYVTPQAAGRVLITQLQHDVPACESHIISKILLKAVCCRPKSSSKSVKNKKDPKTFTLRNIDVVKVDTRDKLKEVIKSQLDNDLVQHFDVGYYQGTTVVSIRSSQDLKEIWQEMRSGTKVVLWCDGLREHEKILGKRKHNSAFSDDSDSEDSQPRPARKAVRSPAINEREKEIEEIMVTLQEKHARKFTQMQYRIWSEMYVGGYFKSLEDHPETSMFAKAGGTQKKSAGPAVEASKNLTSAHSSSSGATVVTSPAKSIESRSKCYKQLVELKNLKTTGILTQEEYDSEKYSIMTHLKKL